MGMRRDSPVPRIFVPERGPVRLPDFCPGLGPMGQLKFGTRRDDCSSATLESTLPKTVHEIYPLPMCLIWYKSNILSSLVKISFVYK